jgi:hypothetical protein
MLAHQVPLRYFLTSLFSKYQQKYNRGCQQVYKPRETKNMERDVGDPNQIIFTAKLRHFKKHVVLLHILFRNERKNA